MRQKDEEDKNQCTFFFSMHPKLFDFHNFLCRHLFYHYPSMSCPSLHPSVSLYMAFPSLYLNFLLYPFIPFHSCSSFPIFTFPFLSFPTLPFLSLPFLSFPFLPFLFYLNTSFPIHHFLSYPYFSFSFSILLPAFLAFRHISFPSSILSLPCYLSSVPFPPCPCPSCSIPTFLSPYWPFPPYPYPSFSSPPFPSPYLPFLPSLPSHFIL